MEGISFFQRLFDYDLWANLEALKSVESMGEAAERPRKFLCHVIGAERVWLSRFESPEHPINEPWPDLTLAECRAAIEEVYQRWMKFLSQLTAEKLAQNLVYRNTKGVEFGTPVQDALMHLVMHSAYHRGQVAAAVREAGGKPAATDYVVYVRQVPPALEKQAKQ